MIHQMKLAKVPFEKIKNGQKIIESRLFDEKRSRININDQIEFVQNENSENKIIVKVKALYRYASFGELFSDFPSAYFGGDSNNELLQEIHAFYSPEDENKFGVIGIRIEKE